MVTKCGGQIFRCVTDTSCKAALDCLQTCEFNDQVGGGGQEGRGHRFNDQVGAQQEWGSQACSWKRGGHRLATDTLAHLESDSQWPADWPVQQPGWGAGAGCTGSTLRPALSAAARTLNGPAALLPAPLQVCSYRCITSYESQLLEDFSLCIIQKHNWCAATPLLGTRSVLGGSG